MTPEITLTDAPDAKARAAIENGLSQYNKAQSLGVCFVDLVFLPDQLRGQDLGTRVMDQAESEARRRGCCAVVLYTISFQAPGFYEKRGYRAFGKIACHPPGTSRIFMVKDL